MTVAVLLRSVPLALAVGIVWAGPAEHLIGGFWTSAEKVFPGLLFEIVGRGGTATVSATRAMVTAAGYIAVAAVPSCLAFAPRRHRVIGTASLLLERDVQVAALRALADTARSGSGRFAVIEGSAGIGKTRLLAEGRAIARSGGCECLRLAAASSRASSPTGSPGSCSSRCSRPSLRNSAPSCSQGLPRS
jgi:hypothetical protein